MAIGGIIIQKIVQEIKDQQLNVYQLAVYTDHGLQTQQIQPASACQPVYSITKVFLNLCIGILADAGAFALDDNLLPFLQPYLPKHYPEIWDTVTIRQALTHRMGLDDGIFDIDRDDTRKYGTDDYLAYILQYPPKFQPGTYRKYTDCAHYLLSLLVQHITGAPADQMIRNSILQPLHCQPTAWTRCPREHTIGATGAYLRAEDVAKLGWLLVNQGVYEEKRIVSSAWVQEMERGRLDVYPIRSTSFFVKNGIHGQCLLYSREKRIAIAWTAQETDEKIKKLQQICVCI